MSMEERAHPPVIPDVAGIRAGNPSSVAGVELGSAYQLIPRVYGLKRGSNLFGHFR